MKDETTLADVSNRKHPFIVHHHHHLVALLARVSLTHCRHPSLSSIAPGKFSRLHPVSALTSGIQVLAGRPTYAHPCARVHKSTSLMSSYLLLQQCPACLVCLIRTIFMMCGKWPYNYCFVGCCLPDLFSMAHSITNGVFGVTSWIFQNILE